MAEEVKLFGIRLGHYSHRVEMTLKLKGIQYEFIEEDLSNKSPLLLEYNPVHKKVPVLLHNGKPILESLLILEYIDETWKDHPILPQDPYGRAVARFWAKVIDEKLQPAAWKVCISQEKEREKAIEEVDQLLKILENELKDKEFFGGESIGYLDIAANCLAYWFYLVKDVSGVELIHEEKFPILHKWSGKLREFAVFKECLPPKEKHLAKIRARLEALSASKLGV